MELATAISLIQNRHFEEIREARTWADLGCGNGLFTHALLSLTADGSTVYAVDKTDNFRKQTITGKEHSKVIFRQQDIEHQLDLPLLDGILMANVLHYILDKDKFLKDLQSYLKPDAILIIVEYDTDKPVNPWVPYPLSFVTLKKRARDAEFHNIERLNSVPSLYHRSDLYAALVAR